MKKLKRQLEKIYLEYSNLEKTSDPLQLVRKLKDKSDIEVFAFIASVFAYGSVKQINSTLEDFLSHCNYQPNRFITKFRTDSSFKLKHRFFSETDSVRLIILLKDALSEYGSLYNLFRKGYQSGDKNVKHSISIFSKYFLTKYELKFGKLTHGIKFMFPLPEKGSACKRMNLFLRWMVRKDNLDFGIWNEIPTNKLIIPVDTNIAQISRRLKLTRLKNISWRMAEEITDNLKKYDKDDPVRFDYALCHFNMLKKNFY